MEFIQKTDPEIKKPIIIAAMQDMGNIGNIVVDFINKNLKTRQFRIAKESFPSYVVDNGGFIDIPEEKWEYRYTDDVIVFGGGFGQPRTAQELHVLCQDVIDVAKKFSTKIIYTVGGFHTNKQLAKFPKTYVTVTTSEIKSQMENLDINLTPSKSVITGFNGLILGYSKLNGISGIGLYGELNYPDIPQYRAAISIIKTLEKLSYQKFGNIEELEILAKDVEENFSKRDSKSFSGFES